MGNCKDCAYWKRNENKAFDNHGLCRAITPATYFNDPPAFIPSTSADIFDDDERKVITRHDFGCVLFVQDSF